LAGFHFLADGEETCPRSMSRGAPGLPAVSTSREALARRADVRAFRPAGRAYIAARPRPVERGGFRQATGSLREQHEPRREPDACTAAPPCVATTRRSGPSLARRKRIDSWVDLTIEGADRPVAITCR